MLNFAGFLLACLKEFWKGSKFQKPCYINITNFLTYKLTCTGPVVRFSALLFAAFSSDHQCRQDMQWSMELFYNHHFPMMGKLSDHHLQGACDDDGVGLPSPSACIPVNVISFGSLTSHSWLSKSSYPPLPPGTAPPWRWLLLPPGPASDRVSENPGGRKHWSQRHLPQPEQTLLTQEPVSICWQQPRLDTLAALLSPAQGAEQPGEGR